MASSTVALNQDHADFPGWFEEPASPAVAGVHGLQREVQSSVSPDADRNPSSPNTQPIATSADAVPGDWAEHGPELGPPASPPSINPDMLHHDRFVFSAAVVQQAVAPKVDLDLAPSLVGSLHEVVSAMEQHPVWTPDLDPEHHGNAAALHAKGVYHADHAVGWPDSRRGAASRGVEETVLARPESPNQQLRIERPCRRKGAVSTNHSSRAHTWKFDQGTLCRPLLLPTSSRATAALAHKRLSLPPCHIIISRLPRDRAKRGYVVDRTAAMP